MSLPGPRFGIAYLHRTALRCLPHQYPTPTREVSSVRAMVSLVACLLPFFHSGGWDKNNTVGKHAGSLLTQKIATNQLADAFMAFNTNYHDTGLFGVYAVTDRDRSKVRIFIAAALDRYSHILVPARQLLA